VTETKLAFRVAGSADVAAIVRLVESAYRGDASRAGWTTEADLLDGQRTDADAVLSGIVSRTARCLLAFAVDRLVACCQLEPHDDGSCHFGMFAVDPSHQAGGIGRAVLDEAERVARDELNAHTMEMTVIAQRSELIEWYERRGYRRSGETRPFPYGDERFGLPRRDDLHFVVLTKQLT
jgi:ribosomal protein S18 acetylase RimI-like enzyme